MRQLTTLPSETDAHRLAAYLVTEKIGAHVEADKAGHIIWVRDEDQISRAKEILAHFRETPGDPRYDGAVRTAEEIRREEDRRRREKLANIVEMRGRWGSGMGIRRRCPAVIALIAISVLVAILTHAGDLWNSTVMRAFLFVDPQLFMPESDMPEAHFWSNIVGGQFWRLVTPIFIHFGIAHLVFNMWGLFVLGAQIEDRRGTLRFLALALTLAVVSNLGEAFASQLRLATQIPMFGGMSGVIYGVFGYLWMKVKFDNAAGFTLSKESVFVMVLWFVLCIVRDFPPFDGWLGGMMGGKVANTAHAVGMFLGIAIGYAPVLFRGK